MCGGVLNASFGAGSEAVNVPQLKRSVLIRPMLHCVGAVYVNRSVYCLGYRAELPTQVQSRQNE